MKIHLAKRVSLAALLMMIGHYGMGLAAAAVPADQLLWADRPVIVPEAASKNLRSLDNIWSQEVYPIGNGRLGCTVFGGPDVERIQFNEDSLWVGNEDHTGGYQPFGDLHIRFGHKEYFDYHRELEISKAVQTVKYVSGGVTYTREYIASYPDQVLAFRFTADKPGALSGKIWLDSMHRSEIADAQGHSKEAMEAIVTKAAGQTLSLIGETKDLFWWPQVMKKGLRGREYLSKEIINLSYEAQARVLHDGGTLSTRGDRIVFSACNEVVVLLAADTNYLNERAKGWRGPHPHARITKQLDDASAKSFDQLMASHVADYQGFYNRFSLNLGDTDPARLKLATADRVNSYQPGNDPGLEVLLYDYARYLMISCSRPGHGGLPANLQGLWLFHLRPAWLCDYQGLQGFCVCAAL